MAVGRDQDVARFEIAMHHVAFVRVLHRVEHPQAQFEPRGSREEMFVGVQIDRRAGHMLHHEIGKAVRRRAAIEEGRDVGVIERREDLALVPEALDDQLRVHAPANHLDGDAPLELVVGAPGQVDRSHPAVSDALLDAVGTERAADIGFRVFEGVLDDAKLDERGLVDEGAGRGVGAEERLDFLAQLPVARAGFIENCGPCIGTCLEGRRQHLLDTTPVSAIHRPGDHTSEPDPSGMLRPAVK